MLATPTQNEFYAYQDSIYLFKANEQSLNFTLVQKYPFSNHLKDLEIKELKIDFIKDSLYLHRYEQDSVFGSHGYPIYQSYGFSLGHGAPADTFKESSKKYNELYYELSGLPKISSYLNYANKREIEVAFRLFENDSTVYRLLSTKLKDDLSRITNPVVQVSAAGDTSIFIAGSDSVGSGPFPHRTVLLAFDGKLNLLWRRNYLQKMNSWAQTLAADENSNLLIGGTYSESKTYYRRYRAFVLGVSSNGSSQSNSVTNVNIYPNPVQDQMRFQFRGPLKSYNIFTLSGVLLEQGQIITQGWQHRINSSTLKPGTYILQFKEEAGRIHSIQFVKSF